MSDGPAGPTPRRARRESWRAAWNRRARAYLPLLFAESAPLDLRILGRPLWRAALVGAGAGLIGAAFFAGAESLQRLLLDQLAGYKVLRAQGETFAADHGTGPFRPWMLLLLPALGGLGCGIVTRAVPETRGGGGDTMLEAFHRRGGVIRRRVIGVKTLASILTLGTGGAGGREGPTMLIGGALGSTVGRMLHVSARERRILLIAGVAAGISAVFRTPLGAALLAVEILALQSVRVSDLAARSGPHVSFHPATPAAEMLSKAGEAVSQGVFPVLDGSGSLRGLVTGDSLRVLAAERELTTWAVAADMMTPPVTVSPHDDLRRATERMVAHGLREIPVLDAGGRPPGDHRSD